MATSGRARYAPAFVERYREAQRQRVARLDEQARRMIAERMQARAALRSRRNPRPNCVARPRTRP